MISAKEFVEESMKAIKDNLGAQKGVFACSGGIDATTATYLMH